MSEWTPAGSRDAALRTRFLPALGALIFAAAALRIALAHYSLWFDEWASVIFAEQPFRVLWSDWMIRETNPPLYYSALRLWMACFGSETTNIRALSIVAGAAGLVPLAAIAVRFYDGRTAVIALALAALSAQHIFYSQMVRGYILAFDSVVLSLLGLLLLVVPAGRVRPALGMLLFGGGAVAAIHCHTTMFLWPAIATAAAVAVIATGDLLRGERLRRIASIVAADAAILMVSSWWLVTTITQMHETSSDIGWIAPLSAYEYQWALSRAITLVRYPQGFDKLGMFTVAIAAAVAVPLTWRNPATRLIAGVLGAAILVFGAAGMVKPIVLERTLFWMSSLTLLLVSAVLGRIANRSARVAATAALGALLTINLIHAAPNFGFQDWHGALKAVAADPDAAIVVQGEAMALAGTTACRVELGATNCPIRIVALADGANAGYAWSAGLLGKPPIPARLIASAVPRRAHIYILLGDGAPPLAGVQAGSGREQRFGNLSLIGPVELAKIMTTR